MGYAVLDLPEKAKSKPPIHVGFGISGLKRLRNDGKDEPFQKYKLRLIDFWITESERLLNSYEPNVVVNEILPSVGGGNFVVATQSQLAATAITVIQVAARQRDIPIEQVGATSVKARIGGSKKATKVQVRNGVIKIMPEMDRYRKDWVKIFEVPDALGVGLTYGGYDNRS